MNSFFFKIALFLFLASFLFAGNRSVEQIIKEKVECLVRDTYQVKKTQVHINWRRLPDLFPYNSGYRTEVRMQNHRLKLGYQTLWVNLLKKGRLIKRVPVSLEISIDRQVIITTRKIKRHQRITPDMLTKRTRRISSDWSSLATSIPEVLGKEAKRVIREGTVLTKNLYRAAPVIHRGDIVTVQVKSSGLTLTTSAYAKEEGSVGETVYIETLQGGKRVKANVQGPGLVVILQEKTI